MSKKYKILIWLSVILLFSSIAFVIYKQFEIAQRQEAIEKNNTEQKQLLDGIIRAQSSYTTKEDLQQFVSLSGVNLKTIQEDLKRLNAEISAANVTVANSKGNYSYNIPTVNGTIANPNPDLDMPDPYGYQKRQQVLKLNEDFGSIQVPIGVVGFSAWQDKPWNMDILPRSYKTTTVISFDKDQKTFTHSKMSVTINDEEFTLPITSSVTKQVYPEASMSFWNPRLYLGVDSLLNINELKPDVSPNISAQIMSYGRFKNQPDISLLQLGLGYSLVSRKPVVTVMPASYNVGKHIPLMRNLYIGPTASLDFSGSFYIGAGLKVGL